MEICELFSVQFCQFYTKTAVVNRFVQLQIKVCAVLHITIGQIYGFLWACESKKAFTFSWASPPDPPPGALFPGTAPRPAYRLAFRARYGTVVNWPCSVFSCKLTLKKALDVI